MTQSTARAGVPPDALELLSEKGSAERALTAALASFQEQVQAVPSLDLAAVVEAAKPAFSSGIAFSAHCIVTWVTCVWLLHQCLAQGGGHAERCCGWEA